MVSLSKLTENETKFLDFYKDGASITNIAYSMKKSIKTIYGYRSSIMFKLKIKNNIQLARIVMESALIKDLHGHGLARIKSKPSEECLKRLECRNISTE